MRRHQWRLLRSVTRSMCLLSPSPSRRLSTTASGGGVAVKKVTRSNFEQTLEELQALVRNSDFVACDLEMSGVTSAPWRETFEVDDSDVQYLKVKDSAEKFTVFQFGVCPFRWDSSKESFIAHPHNFYLFPRKELLVGGPSFDFLCQTSSIDFLSKHQFDFNACIHDGISYLSREQESQALLSFSSEIDGKSANSPKSFSESDEITITSTSDILFTERIKNKFMEWRDGIVRGCTTSRNADCISPHFQTTFFKTRPAVLLGGFSSHQHKLIQQVIRKYLRDLVYVGTNDENSADQRIVIYCISETDKAMLVKEVKDDLWRMARDKIRSAVGFRHVIDLLASEQKLIVGHSCILDVAHMYNKFLGPLPPSITEFASSLHRYFPHIIDTKHLLNSNETLQRLMDKKSKSLSSAFAVLCPELNFSSSSHSSTFCQNVKVEVPVDETRSCWSSGAKHDAGYDAFMTGCVFAQASSFLGIDFKCHPLSSGLHSSEKLQKHVNLLYPSWKSETAIDLRTGIEVPQSGIHCIKRKHTKMEFANVVIIWGFLPMIKPFELKECISKFCGIDSVTSIFNVDKTAALVQFNMYETATKFLLLKDSLERNNNVVSVLHPLSKLLDGGSTRAARYDVYKEICSFSASKVFFADQADAVGIRWMTKIESDGLDS